MRRRPLIVLIADIVASRRLAERSVVQRRLGTCLRRLNARKGGGLISPYTVTLGDEFQAVFSGPERLFLDALAILIALYPVEVRFSWSVGEVQTAINRKQAIGMDGPAFHEARRSVLRLKKTKSWFVVSGAGGDALRLMNPCLDLVSHMFRKWPRSRLTILKGLLEGHDIRELARDLHITDKAIYKSIDAGAIRTLVGVFQEITGRLGDALKIP